MPTPDVPFVNEVRLSARNWLVACLLIVGVLWAIPRLWKRVERFETGPDYRVPYSLSRDYWLYQRRLDLLPADQIVILGDSVVWGEYVLPNGTLSHFLNGQLDQAQQFVNGGVNGLFPLALEGLVDSYATALHDRKVILHCNLLWLSSPKADLQVQKEEKFNHSRLVPQFSPQIPCYRANANERLSVVIERNVQFMSWVSHLQSAYFDDRSIPAWTLAEDSSSDQPQYPNSYQNPLRRITLEVPVAPIDDPLRGPTSSRHIPWTHQGAKATQFEWVDIDSSLQWAAFKRVLGKLESRGNDVLVILGPFNEHMIAAESMPAYRKLHEGVVDWLNRGRAPFIALEPLASELYADASHPLTDGYQKLSEILKNSSVFQKFALVKAPAAGPASSVER